MSVTYRPGDVLGLDETAKPLVRWLAYGTEGAELAAVCYIAGGLLSHDNDGWHYLDTRDPAKPVRRRVSERTFRARACMPANLPLLAGQEDVADEYVHLPEKRVHTCTPPPPLAADQALLDHFACAVACAGLVGERTTAQLIYLVLTSRLLERPVSLGVKGTSSAGKSFLVETVSRFFPPDAVIAMTAMSQRALVYNDKDFAHRALVLYEVVGLREGVEDDLTSYFMRSLLSEGRIVYPVTVKGKDGGYTTKTITKEGPTGLVFTTTRARIHGENETRVLSVTVDDTKDQTARVFRAWRPTTAPPQT